MQEINCRQLFLTLDSLTDAGDQLLTTSFRLLSFYSIRVNYSPVDIPLFSSVDCFYSKSEDYRLVDSSFQLSTGLLRIRVFQFMQELFSESGLGSNLFYFFFFILVSYLEKYSYFICLYKGHCILDFYYSTFNQYILSFSHICSWIRVVLFGSQIRVVLAHEFEYYP